MYSAGYAPWHILFIVVLVAVIAALVALWATALLSISRADYVSGTERAVWVLVVVLAPLLGAIAWFAIGRRKSP